MISLSLYVSRSTSLSSPFSPSLFFLSFFHFLSSFSLSLPTLSSPVYLSLTLIFLFLSVSFCFFLFHAHLTFSLFFISTHFLFSSFWKKKQIPFSCTLPLSLYIFFSSHPTFSFQILVKATLSKLNCKLIHSFLNFHVFLYKSKVVPSSEIWKKKKKKKIWRQELF